MRSAARIPHTEGDDDSDTLVMSVKLRSGRFESTIEVPLFASENEAKAFVEQWMELMKMGLSLGKANREAAKPPPSKND